MMRVRDEFWLYVNCCLAVPKRISPCLWSPRAVLSEWINQASARSSLAPLNACGARGAGGAPPRPGTVEIGALEIALKKSRATLGARIHPHI